MADLFGTTGDDTLTGALEEDLLVGDLGDDVLQGLGGSDELVGGEGADTLDGGDGDDSIWAGKGDDSIIGGSGTDTAHYHSNGTEEGVATQGVVVDLTLGTAADGWGSNDKIVGVENVGGTSFDDILTGDMNANVLSGYEGSDTLSGGGGNDILYGGIDDNVLNGGDGDDFLDGDDGNDTLHGDAGDDELAGGDGNDGLFGGAGNDSIWGAAGDDMIDGGDGYDIAYFHSDGFGSPVPGSITVNLVNGTVVDGWGGTDTLVSIEEIVGTDFADNFTGNADGNVFYGIDGDDIISGGVALSAQSFDYLYGGAGSDTISFNRGFAAGGLGDDRISGQSTTSAFAAAGVSFLDATSGIVANLTASTHNGLAGGDAVNGFSVSDGVGGVDLISDLHVIHGSDFDDVFYIDSSWVSGGSNSLEVRTGEGNDNVNFVGVDGAVLSYQEASGGVRADLAAGTATDMIADNRFVGDDTFTGVNTFYGSDVGDVIDGSNDGETLGGNAGNDTIGGLAGNDALFGDTGDDTLNGGTGNDWVEGGSGADIMRGGAGDDAYIVDNSSDTIDEAASGSSGTDEVQSSITFDLNNSARVLGNFEELYLTGSATINGIGNALDNTIGGNDGANALFGNAGNDYLRGGGGDDMLYGGTGDDWLAGEAGADVIRGGAGNDAYIVDSSSDTIDEAASGSSGTDEVQSSVTFSLNNSSRVLGNFERLFLTGSANINGTGNALGNALVGNSGANGLVGNAGDDYLLGGGGNDTLSGGTGNDRLEGGSGSDVMRGGAGNDAYIVDASDTLDEAASGSSGTDEVQSSVTFSLNNSSRVLGNFEKLFLTGSANINGIGNALGNTIVGNNGVNGLVGNAGNDYLDGKGGNDTLSGGTGNDWLEGGSGSDIMRGGAGNDVYVVNSSSDTIDERVSGSSGTDEVHSTFSFNLNNSAHVLGNFENLSLMGTASINGTGNSLNNTIWGNTGANSLVGNAGNDSLQGKAGNDTLSGGTGNDILVGGTGADIMRGGAGNDDYVVDGTTDTIDERASGSSGMDTVHSSISFNLNSSARVLGSFERIVLTGTGNFNGTGNSLSNTITGNAGANILVGNAGNDSLYGNGGNDRINGGAGNDTLLGGGGKDVFVFNTAVSSKSNVDYIIDFKHADDTFWLDNAVMKALGSTGALSSGQFWKSTSGTAHDANDHVIYDTDSGNLFYDSNGSASGSSILIARLNPHLVLDASDFVVI